MHARNATTKLMTSDSFTLPDIAGVLRHRAKQ
jgi:hypothetical protein